MDTHHLINTIAISLFLGVLFIAIARRIKISAIILLLLGGVLCGPHFLNLVDPAYLGSDLLRAIVSMSVGLILFEGGLTLDPKGYRTISREIMGLLTIGVLATLVVTCLLIRVVLKLDWSVCLVAASLVIVTGPTVIGPLLQRVRIKNKLHRILYWEGVLIDPIGVFVVLLCYEWIVGQTTAEAPLNFLIRLGLGILIGLVGGIIIQKTLSRGWVHDDYLNIFAVACALLTFAIADNLMTESGLLAVTIAGFWVGYKNTPNIDRIIQYKSELKDLLIGLLFVLLAANLDLNRFAEYGEVLLWLLAGVILIVRPICVFLATHGSSLIFKEKLFLSWIAPRGIVAASMASLFALQLSTLGLDHAGFLEAFTYTVIAGTVLIQALTASWVAKLLGVQEVQPTGWLIVGAHKLARSVARFVRECGFEPILLDSNQRSIGQAQSEGIPAISGNALLTSPDNQWALYHVGQMLAVTPNEELNRLVCQRWSVILGKDSVYCWSEDSHTDDINAKIFVGTPVWPELGRAKVFGGYMEVETLDVRLEEIDQPDRVLMCYHNKKLYPGLPKNGASGEAKVLMAKEN